MIMRKLKTRDGASITFALLLFLVCAVVSSVVIVTATTAAGRMSQLARMDQRYYAVTSAAEMLRDFIDGKVVDVDYQTKTDGAITKITAGAPGAAAPTEWTSASTIDQLLLMPTTAPSPNGLVADVSRRYVEAYYLNRSTPVTTPVAWEYEISLDPALANGDLANAALDCSIDAKLTNGGLLECDISNIVPESVPNKQIYTLHIVFSSNIQEFASSVAASKHVRLTWKLHSMQIVKAAKAS